MSDKTSDRSLQGTAPTVMDNIQVAPPNLMEWFGYDAGLASSSIPSSATTSISSLSPEDQRRKMESIVEIFDLKEDHDEEMRDEDDEESIVDLEDQQRRTERLRGVFPALRQLWQSSSDYVDLIAEKLGDGSRDRKSPQLKTIEPLVSASS